MEFAKRMNRFEAGIFSRLLDMKKERLAAGGAVVDLSIGAPNIPPTQPMMQALADAALDPANYVYAIQDLPELHQAVAGWYQRRYGVTLDPERQITSLLGSQEGLAHIALTVADEGDVVLVPDPCYPVFADGPKLAGAELHYMPQKPENGFVIDLRDIPAEVAKRAKLMIVSYPNNPTTVMAPDRFYRDLIAFAKEYDIWVLHDNAYSELVYDGAQCGSFLRFDGAADVGVEFNALSKTYALAGARIGFCVGNPELVGMLARLKSNLDYGMFLPIQKAAIAAITGDQSCVASTRRAYELRRNFLCDGLTALGWDVPRCPSTMFVWARIPEHFADSQTFCEELLRRAGMLVTPGSAFGPSGEGYVRMALVRTEEEMAQALEGIRTSGILQR